MADRISQQVGNYNLIRLLGKGGFAEVYLGEHIYLRTQAAIKMLSVRLPDADQKAFFHEAQIVARLNHPHIVQVLDFGIEEHIPFLVMQYAPNGTLRQRHPKNVPVPLTIVLRYILQVGEALQYAHDQQLVHRDVKPGNMLVGKNEDILLSDFGTALAIQSSITLKRDEMMVGTPSYTAPEQLQGNATFASDQYALGMVAYEWLTGIRPFRGQFDEVARQHLFTPPPPLRERMPNIPPRVEYVILKALEKAQEQRFASVREFALALKEACLLDEPATIRIFTNKPSLAPLPSYTPSGLPTVTLYPPSTPPILPVVTLPTPVVHPPSTPAKKDLSRRAFLAGGVGLVAAAAVGGGLTWLWLSHQVSLPLLPSLSGVTPETPRQPVHGLLYTYNGHNGMVNAVSWSPDGTRIASGGNDTTVQVWDAANGGNVITFHGHTGPVRSVDWSHNQLRIASGSHDKTVQVWDSNSGQNVYAYRQPLSPVSAAMWSPDDTQIASANSGMVRVWNATNGNKVYLYHGHNDRVNALAWSPDGKMLASASTDQSVYVWEATTGANVFIYKGHSDGVRTVAWSHDGKYIASGSLDMTVQVWDATTGHLLNTYRGHTAAVNAVAWLHDGTRLVSGSVDKTAQVWDAATGNNVFTYNGHTGAVNAVSTSSDSIRLVSGSSDKSVQVWKVV